MSAPVRTIEISVPLPWDRRAEPDVPALARDLRLLWIIDEVRQRRLGVGKGSKLAEMPRAAFMRVLGEHGVPVIDHSVEDLDREPGEKERIRESTKRMMAVHDKALRKLAK